MWGTSETASEEDLRYLVLVGWLFRIRAGFEWLKTGHVSCCSETDDNVCVSPAKMLHKTEISINLYGSIY